MIRIKWGASHVPPSLPDNLKTVVWKPLSDTFLGTVYQTNIRGHVTTESGDVEHHRYIIVVTMQGIAIRGGPGGYDYESSPFIGSFDGGLAWRFLAATHGIDRAEQLLETISQMEPV